jgi:uncharacterized protein
MEQLFKSLQTINYWNQKPAFNTGYNRRFYLDTIKNSLNNKLIKVLVGQRRAGKSYIIRQIMKYLVMDKQINPGNIFYLNKEMYEFELINQASSLASLIDLYHLKIEPEGKIYIFIDEIQEIDGWEKIIVSLAQHPVRDYEIFITGSNSKLLSGELASNIAGRYIVFEIAPFSYVEFLDFYKLENNRQNFIRYFETGGLPEIYNIESEEIRKNYLNSLKDSILLKDIMYRYKLRDYVLLEDLFLFVIHNVGCLTSIPSIIKYFKSKNRRVDYATISAYLSYMEEAFFILQSPRYHLKNKELLSGEKKYYINDLAFRNYLFPRLKTDFAAILENLVFTHLRIAGYQVFTGSDADYEIDFIAFKKEAPIYLQVTYLLESNKTIAREFGSFKNIKDHFSKYVLSMDDMTLSNPEGIKHENIWNFLYGLLKFD